MAEILGKEPATYACTLTAVDMAKAAYRQAAHLSEFGVPIVGVSCTCALATDRPKKGDHKVLYSICNQESQYDWHMHHLGKEKNCQFESYQGQTLPMDTFSSALYA